MTKNPKVVIDTNVWVSALVFGGNPEAVIELFISGKITAIISEEIISELRRIITDKFPLFIHKMKPLEASIRKDALLVPIGNHIINVSRDPDDNKVIETAIVGDATYLISGDNDLLILKKYGNLDILSPATFISIHGR